MFSRALFAIFVVVVLRTAWLSDDAFITFRTVDNFVSGYGLRWNVGERVQSYTHPLWLLLLSIPYAVTREAYFTPLLLSMALAFLAVWLFLARIASSTWTASVGVAVFIFSRAFVEYSTSGLENALTCFLLAAFFAVYWSTPRRPLVLWLLTALVMTNRLDAGLLLLPVLAADAWGAPWRETLRAALLGLVPLVAWEIVSLVYYGFLVPNTAYAKLQTGFTAGQLIGQGLRYLVDSIRHDPVTPLAIGVASLVALIHSPRRTWPIVLGVWILVAYVVRVGGDFMSGRFLVAPLFTSVLLLGHLRLDGPRKLMPSAALAVALLGSFVTVNAPITSTSETFIPLEDEGRVDDPSGIADERMYYYRYTGLLRWRPDDRLPNGGLVEDGLKIRGQRQVVRGVNAGFFGYFAGPAVHIVDVFALCDPLLARLPAFPDSRIGHFERGIPDGYFESIASGENRVEDPEVKRLYEDVRLITTGAIWSGARWRAIVRLNLGR